MTMVGVRAHRRWLLAAAALVVLGSLAAVTVNRRHPANLADAIRIASDEGRFASSPRAGDSLVRITDVLIREGRACVAAHGRDYRPCQARASGAAVAQSAAVVAVHCTQPGVYEARVGMLRYLEGIRRLDRDPSGPAPPFPQFPVC